MRAWIIVTAVLLGLGPAAAADLYGSDTGRRPPHRRAVDPYGYGGGYGYAQTQISRYNLQPTPYVVAPPAAVMVVPPNASPAPLRYAPPPLYPGTPPLITALPIVGGFLVPVPGPPPATILDAYDYRFDYNQ